MTIDELKEVFTTEVVFFYVTMGYQIINRKDAAFLLEKAQEGYKLFDSLTVEKNLPSIPFEEFVAYLVAGIVQTRTVDSMLDSTPCGRDILNKIVGPTPLDKKDEDKKEEDTEGPQIIFEDKSN